MKVRNPANDVQSVTVRTKAGIPKGTLILRAGNRVRFHGQLVTFNGRRITKAKARQLIGLLVKSRNARKFPRLLRNVAQRRKAQDRKGRLEAAKKSYRTQVGVSSSDRSSTIQRLRALKFLREYPTLNSFLNAVVSRAHTRRWNNSERVWDRKVTTFISKLRKV